MKKENRAISWCVREVVGYSGVDTFTVTHVTISVLKTTITLADVASISVLALCICTEICVLFAFINVCMGRHRSQDDGEASRA